MRTTFRSLAVSAAMFLLVACGSGAAGPSSTPPASEPPVSISPIGPEGEWRLTAGTVDGVPLVLAADHPITLSVGGSSVDGQSACNHYFGDFGVVDGRISLTNLGGTEMACEEPVMTLEAAYMQGLAAVQGATVNSDSLALAGPGVLLQFERVVPPPVSDMVGTDWLLESVLSGDAAMSPLGDPVTLRFDEDGTFSGTTGCRTFSGSYTLNGEQVAITQWALEGECEGDVAAQDSMIVTVLGDGFQVSLDQNQLSLGDDSGSGLDYMAQPEG
jgi:heat shock protein HslJ